MGTLKQGILGGFSGKVGTVIGFTRKGVSYIRGLMTSSNNPNTPAQQEQRAKFALVMKFLRPLVALLRIGFKPASSTLTGFNAAMSYTLANAVMGAFPAFQIDYSKVLVCQGSLPGALNPEAESTVAGKINFTWDNNAWDFGADVTDKVVVVVYNPVKQKTVSVIGEATRADGTLTMDVPELFSADQVQCYIGFTNAAKTQFSNGEFLSSVNVM